MIDIRGRRQALDLLARVLLDPGDEVWMEDLGYPAGKNSTQGDDR
jgi:GntR family transcriptional regulator / MocR family aminotransferase